MKTSFAIGQNLPSIRQNPSHPLPDWRNLGVLLRVLLGVNGLTLAAALVAATSLWDWPARFVESAAWVEPQLFLDLLLLAAGRDLLWRLSPAAGRLVVLAGVALCGALCWDAWRFLGLTGGGPEVLLRAVLLALFAAGALLIHFERRAQALAPRLTEARLQALNARIRPHFLFNALNSVIALIRSEPRRAEAALEELAELFRALLREPRELVPLSAEIALARQYLDLEKLRLGERLQAVWDVRAVPLDAPVPPLMLQPLLENAVLHGIEPAPAGGEIRVSLDRQGDRLVLEVVNPLGAAPAGGRARAGQHMALGNLRDRLALFYDLEASLEHGPAGQNYHVRIVFPCRTQKLPRP
jgi:two-component system sensor histidine kinase AlgZ